MTYFRYLLGLQEYLEGFFTRVKPLMNLTEFKQNATDEFTKNWESGTLSGWEEEIAEIRQRILNPAFIADPQNQDTVPLETRLFCAACRPLLINSLGRKEYSKETVYMAHLNSKKHIKANEVVMNLSLNELGTYGVLISRTNQTGILQGRMD